MPPITLFNSKKEFAIKLGLALTIQAGGLVLYLNPEWAANVGPRLDTVYAVIVLSIPATFVFAWRLFDSRPRIVIDDAGVFDRLTQRRAVPWSEIVNVYHAVETTEVICLEIRDKAKRSEFLTSAGRRLSSDKEKDGWGDVNINLADLDAEPHQILQAIRLKIQRSGIAADPGKI